MFKSLLFSAGDFVNIYRRTYLCDRLRRAAADNLN